MDILNRFLAPHPRLRVARPGLPDPNGQCVLYWMQRSQRGVDNPALNLAIELANTLGLPILSVFGLTPSYPGAQRRHYRFMLEGLVDAANDLEKRGVPLILRLGEPQEVVTALARETKAAVVVGDENPLHIGKLWRQRVAEHLKVPFYLVDADVIIPSSHFPNEEYAARTIRPKIHRLLAEYLKPMSNPKAHIPWRGPLPRGVAIDPAGLLDKLRIGGSTEVPDFPGGSQAAHARLRRFLNDRLPRYATERNEPTPYFTSELSAHLHFGQISPLKIALAVRDTNAPQESIDAYLEELIVRRELAINYVARNTNYDQLAGCPDWARKTLAEHAQDRRPFLYNSMQFEAAATHDPLWNAAQLEMVHTGRMHNYLRMYWAKKILEWSPDAETAFEIAIDLNDRYEMDGRDPNGFTGVAWAIGGKHDRPWPSRPINGTERSMSGQGMSKKIDTVAYISRVNSLVK